VRGTSSIALAGDRRAGLKDDLSVFPKERECAAAPDPIIGGSAHLTKLKAVSNRRVIDGPQHGDNNSGPAVPDARDEVVSLTPRTAQTLTYCRG
jgi:hypothetical protein